MPHDQKKRRVNGTRQLKKSHPSQRKPIAHKVKAKNSAIKLTDHTEPAEQIDLLMTRYKNIHKRI